tara:strand:+ start:1266 stop:1907 length:642 start_codon:yes stop_codon:yes gene_type:complete
MKTKEYNIATKKGFSKEDLEDVINIEKFKQGDVSAYGYIYQKYYKIVLFELTKKYSGDVEKAKDLTSEVMIKVMDTITKYSVEKGSGNFGGWIRKVAKNAFLDKKRSKNYKFSKNVDSINKTINIGGEQVNLIQIVEPNLNAEENLITNELQTEINIKLKDLVSKLSKEEQEILHLRIDCDLSFEDIAKEISKTKNYCLVKFHRIKNKIKKEL